MRNPLLLSALLLPVSVVGAQGASVDEALSALGADFAKLLASDDDAVWFLERFTPEARERIGDERLLGYFAMFRRDVPGATLHGVERQGGTQAQLVLYSREKDLSARFDLDLEPDPPYRIAGLDAGLQPGAPLDLDVDGPATPAAIAHAVSALVDELAGADRFSGAVLLAKDGEVLLSKAVGLADRSFDVPNRVDTKFNLGSMNKMFTAVAVLQLVQEGLLELDAHLADVLPDYPNRAVAERITIHQLLTHTSGLGDFFDAMSERDWTRLREPADHLPLFADEPLLFEPGERFSYSNAGFLVLGLVIEAVTGESYYDYVREHVYAPAGMTSTDCWAIDEVVPNLAIGYTRSGPDGHGRDGPLRSNVFLHRARGGPAGGGFSTVEDLLRFARALQAHVLLDEATTELLLEGKIGVDPDARYAYGFLDRALNGHRTVGHNGGAPGINGELVIFPDDGWVVAVLVNCDGAATALAERVCEEIAGGEG